MCEIFQCSSAKSHDVLKFKYMRRFETSGNNSRENMEVDTSLKVKRRLGLGGRDQRRRVGRESEGTQLAREIGASVVAIVVTLEIALSLLSR